MRRRGVSRAPVLGGFLVLGLVVGALLARKDTTLRLDSREALRDEGARLREQLQAWEHRARAAGVEAAGDAGGCRCDASREDAGGTVQAAKVVDAQLAKVLAQAANSDKEVMLALANGVMICKNTTICWWNGGNILQTWLEMVQHQGISNVVLGILDDETWAYMNLHWPHVIKFRPKMLIPESQKGSHPANMVSTLKYGLLKDILRMGYHVLVADMDLIFLDNPFKHLYRDSDIESQTDGFEAGWAYGKLGSIHDPTMGWGAGGLYVQTFTLNVGCVYVRATARSIDLMERVEHRLATQGGWDQQVFNEEAFFLSHGEVKRANVDVRVMDYLDFAHSKTFFRSQRKLFFPGSQATHTPVMIHNNYHPDKHKRMLCYVDRYFHGKLDACDNLPTGSEPGS